MSDDLKQRFDDAVGRSKSLPSQSNDNLLKLYALYKQGTQGDASGKRPGRLDIKGRAKFDAWDAKKGTSRDDAMQQYIDLVDSLGR